MTRHSKDALLRLDDSLVAIKKEICEKANVFYSSDQSDDHHKASECSGGDHQHDSNQNHEGPQ